MADIRETMSNELPELALFDSHERAKAAYALAHGRVHLSRRFWLWYAPGLVVCEVVLYFALHRFWPSMPHQWRVGIISVFSVIYLTILLRYVLRNDMRRHIRQQLIDQCFPVCLRCGYDLRGQTEPRCPECGASCDPALIRRNPSND
jgi:hypothetical protein